MSGKAVTSITVKKIRHADEVKIGLFFPYDTEIQAKLQTIGAQWSRTLRCWHIPYTREAYRQLMQLSIDLIIPEGQNKSEKVAGMKHGREIPPIARGDSPHPNQLATGDHKPKNWVDKYPDLRLMESIGKYWVFRMNYRQGLVKALLKIKGVYWNKTYKCYMAMQHPQVREAIHEALGVSTFLPGPDMARHKTGADKGTEAKLCAHPPDIRLMQVHLPAHHAFFDKIKRLAYSRYSRAFNCYLLPATQENVALLKQLFEPENIRWHEETPDGYLKKTNARRHKDRDLTKRKSHLLDQVPDHARPWVEAFLNLLIAKNYSPATVRNYGGAFVRFCRDHGYANPSQMGEKEVISYLASLVEKGLGSANGHTLVNALKFYYQQVQKQYGWQLQLPRPKKEVKLPAVLTVEECLRIFKTVTNNKHKLILLLTYGAGLRVSEVVNLKWGDLLMEEHKIHLKSSKGKKDRIVMLPQSVRAYLTHYSQLYRTSKAHEYVFQGQYTGEPYSVSSVQQVMRKAVKQSELSKKATVHTLRHSFATHLLENGTDIRYIQALLGHNSIKTTTIYTHLTKTKMDSITSPLDKLWQDKTTKK